MDTDLIEQTVVVTATIAQEADGHTKHCRPRGTPGR